MVLLKESASPDRTTNVPKKNPDRNIVVVIPELVEDHWYEYFFHNQRARLLE
jgi:hypothetical protein